jgi:hypothetical protein
VIIFVEDYIVCFTGKLGDVLHLLRACKEVVLYEYI